MKSVNQTITEEEGNCFEASIASILEIPIEQVPDFQSTNDAGPWMDEFNEWLRLFGLQAVHLEPAERNMELVRDCCCEATIRSPRMYWLYHSVVVKNGVVIHDPHPSKESLGKAEKLIAVLAFVAIDPAKERE